MYLQSSVLSRLAFFILLSLLLFSTLPSPAYCETDLYGVLGLKPDASDNAIKKAYRKLSLQYHPDKNKGDAQAQQRYMDIQHAHEVLSDEEKKLIYDMEGEEGLERQAKGGQGGGGGLFDLFGNQMGGGGGKRKGPDYRMAFDVTLEDLYNGVDKSIKISRNVICKACKGTGAKDGKTQQCRHCGGKGQTMSLQQIAPGFNVQMQTPCPHCGGKGKTASAACTVCGGKKVKQEEKLLELTIERGMADGTEITFARASEQSPESTPGDVILSLKQQGHPRFTRKGDDLHLTQHIQLSEALLGFKTSVQHLDRPVTRRVPLEWEGVTQPDEVRVEKEEGMPKHEMSSEKGDLYVQYQIVWPKTLSQQQKEAIKALLS